MAAKRTAVKDEAPAPTGYNMGFDASDLTLPRLRVVGKDARLVELEVAKAGDIAIGSDAEDQDSNVFPNPGNVTVYILGEPHVNYACGFNGPDGVFAQLKKAATPLPALTAQMQGAGMIDAGKLVR